MIDTRIKVLVILFFAFSSSVMLIAVAWSHGTASWIMANPATSYCCGPKDCTKLSKVEYTVMGWTFENPITRQTEFVKFDTQYPSIDEDYWACFVLDGQSTKLRCSEDRGKCCFFAPLSGV